MSVMEGFLLGLVQGLTEFLPISSSGHLVLAQNLLGLKDPELLLDCALHFGTLVSICIFFWADIKAVLAEAGQLLRALSRRRDANNAGSDRLQDGLLLWILAGSVPTALIGLLFMDFIKGLFASPGAVGLALIFTGVLVGVSRFLPEDYTIREHVGLSTSLLIGVAQGLALVPGISRSGITIASGLVLKLNPNLATRFSFLLALPAILGALGLQLKAAGLSGGDLPALLTGFLTSTLTGLLALKVLIGVVRKGRLYYFAPYCWVLGIATLLLV